MHFDQTLKNLLEEASLYGLLAKRYEYSDPQRHIYFYQKHFNAVMKLEQHYMMMESKSNSHQKMKSGNFPMY
ncbi:hypothetical protein [Virgibacillus sediminis]|uniref:Uncharacterized protein n=1 Tax=Virgibacillus sediminis TaxID=202260 RepID=A0ABV7AAX0_9BACI